MSKPQICQVIGDPISQSLSPYLHNQAYDHLGIADQFIYEAQQVTSVGLGEYINSVRGSNIRGLSVTIPHKIAIIELLDELDPLAGKIGAVNTVVHDNGRLIGYNTDVEGVSGPLMQRTMLTGTQTLVLGAGGAARAAVFALIGHGADVSIANRTLDKAQQLADDAGVEVYSGDLSDVSQFDLIFNATSVGMSPHDDESPLPEGAISSHQIVFDAVYKPLHTRLLQSAEQVGAATITGLEMLAHQAVGQIKHFTNRDVEPEFIHDLLKEKISD